MTRGDAETERLLAKERLGLTVEDAERRAAEAAARAERDAETSEKLRAYAAALRGVPQPTVTDPHALAAVESGARRAGGGLRSARRGCRVAHQPRGGQGGAVVTESERILLTKERLAALWNDIAKALGDDATLYVERRPDGTWNAEVDFMAETIGDGGPTLAEAVAAALSDLATERARDPSHRLRDSVRGLLRVRDGTETGEAAEAIVAQARRLAGGE